MSIPYNSQEGDPKREGSGESPLGVPVGVASSKPGPSQNGGLVCPGAWKCQFLGSLLPSDSTWVDLSPPARGVPASSSSSSCTFLHSPTVGSWIPARALAGFPRAHTLPALPAEMKATHQGHRGGGCAAGAKNVASGEAVTCGPWSAWAGVIAHRLVSSSLVCILEDFLRQVWGRPCWGRSILGSAGFSCTFLVPAGVHTSGFTARREDSPWGGEHLWSELQGDARLKCCRMTAARVPRTGLRTGPRTVPSPPRL